MFTQKTGLQGTTLLLLIRFDMKYLLVIQWPAISIEDYDTLIEIEDILSLRLSKESEIDGHDAGAGEMNIFISTDNPRQTFQEVQGVLGPGFLGGRSCGLPGRDKKRLYGSLAGRVNRIQSDLIANDENGSAGTLLPKADI